MLYTMKGPRCEGCPFTLNPLPPCRASLAPTTHNYPPQHSSVYAPNPPASQGAPAPPCHGVTPSFNAPSGTPPRLASATGARVRNRTPQSKGAWRTRIRSRRLFPASILLSLGAPSEHLYAHLRP